MNAIKLNCTIDLPTYILYDLYLRVLVKTALIHIVTDSFTNEYIAPIPKECCVVGCGGGVGWGVWVWSHLELEQEIFLNRQQP